MARNAYRNRYQSCIYTRFFISNTILQKYCSCKDNGRDITPQQPMDKDKRNTELNTMKDICGKINLPFQGDGHQYIISPGTARKLQ